MSVAAKVKGTKTKNFYRLPAVIDKEGEIILELTTEEEQPGFVL